jgi:hypothetical protein
MTAYVTRSEVHATADRVDAEGRKPAATNVREIIGRGSYSTITAHLQSWTPPDQRLQLPPVPDGLSSAVNVLTGDLWHMARIASQAEAAARIEQANAEVQDARAAAAHVGEQADRLAADLEAAQQRIAGLEQIVTERDQQLNECAEYIRQWEVEAARKTGEIETLQRTLAQFAPATADTRKTTKQKAADEQPAA